MNFLKNIIKYLSSIRRAFIFLMRQQTGLHSNITRSQGEIKIRGNSVPYDLYFEKGHRKKDVRTIIAIHGMIPLGYRDPRMINLAKSLAECGHRVVLPQFSGISALKIRFEDIDLIEEVIEKISMNSEPCPSGRVAIFAASFSAGMVLIASGRPSISARVSSICTIGSYCNVDSSFDYVMRNQNIDSYGRMVTFFNFLHLSKGKNPKLQKAFEIAALDNVFRRKNKELPLYLSTLPQKEKKIFLDLNRNGEKRLYHYHRFRPKIKDIINSFYVLDKLNGIKASVTLIHGEEDNVIPAKDSRILHNKFRELGLSSRLHISRVLSHSEGRLSIGLIPDIIRLLLTFAFFLRRV